jgi:2-hydroxy-3-keto-5-methylthiopentenyl-1-phosphate phosphatase
LVNAEIEWYNWPMNEPVIAIIFDFDETLGPDTISFFLQEQGVDVRKFWQGVNKMVKQAWDPPLAYMHKMFELAKKGKLDIAKSTMVRIGKKLPLFPGLPNALHELRQFVKNNEELKEGGISLEYYIISGGLEELIRATKVAPHVNGVFGCNFAYEKNGDVIGTESAISFTEKTRYVYGIRKGIPVKDLRANPYRVNDAMPAGMRRIPFSQMIYIGDGPSDIPSLSAITSEGGMGIGVSAPFGSFKKGYELARGKRITVGPYTANYKKGSDMRKVLEETILRIGLEIMTEQKKKIVSSPTA